MRGVAKKKNGGSLFLARQVAKEKRWLRSWQKQIPPPDFLPGIFERDCENLCRLRSTNIRTSQKKVGGCAERGHTSRHRLRFLHSLFRQIPFGIGRTLGILAIDGNTVPHDVKP